MASIFMMRARQSHARRKAGNPYGSDLEEVKGNQRKATNERVKVLEDNSNPDKEAERRDPNRVPKVLQELYADIPKIDLEAE